MTPIHGWEINRLAAALGAEVRGVQLAGADADIAQQVLGVKYLPRLRKL